MMKNLDKDICYFVLIYFCACTGNSSKNTQKSNLPILVETEYNHNLIDSLKSDLRSHSFKSFENKLIINKLCSYRYIKNRRYLVPNNNLNDDLRYMVFEYYLLYAYDDYVSGIKTLDLLGYVPQTVQYDDKLRIAYKNMKNIIYSNENMEDIRNDWKELKLIKSQNPKDDNIDLMYYLSKSGLFNYIDDKTLVNDTLNVNDQKYLYNKAFSNDLNHLKYSRILLSISNLNGSANEFKRLKKMYSASVKEYYDFSITENYHFGDTVRVSIEEIQKIWQYGNFKDSLVGNLIFLNRLIMKGKYNEVVQISHNMYEPLLIKYDDNRFMVEYRNTLIKYGALALFLQSKFKEYYQYIESMKFELKGYDLDEKRNFEKFTKEFYLKYYKGDSEFSKILRDCYS